ncbi:hypothetical protein BJY52DRAFT_1418801 [Lactarius psammicola]|nr:hypothetical protein BJY52DRAFT_1418801 [Lactarius psammicola]
MMTELTLESVQFSIHPTSLTPASANQLKQNVTVAPLIGVSKLLTSTAGLVFTVTAVGTYLTSARYPVPVSPATAASSPPVPSLYVYTHELHNPGQIHRPPNSASTKTYPDPPKTPPPFQIRLKGYGLRNRLTGTRRPRDLSIRKNASSAAPKGTMIGCINLPTTGPGLGKIYRGNPELFSITTEVHAPRRHGIVVPSGFAAIHPYVYSRYSLELSPTPNDVLFAKTPVTRRQVHERASAYARRVGNYSSRTVTRCWLGSPNVGVSKAAVRVART